MPKRRVYRRVSGRPKALEVIEDEDGFSPITAPEVTACEPSWFKTGILDVDGKPLEAYDSGFDQGFVGFYELNEDDDED